MTFTQVLNAGIQKEQPSHLQKKIRIANGVALIVGFGVAIPFILISWAYFLPLILVPIIGLIISLGAIGLNAMGAQTPGRTIISLLPLILAATYNMGLAAVGEPPVFGISMVELSFSITVFLVFDLREKEYLIPMAIISLLIILSFPYTQHWWEPELDATIIREGYVGTIAVLTSVLFAFGSVFTLVTQNQKSEKDTAQLLAEANATNQKAQQSEQELKESLKQLEEAQKEEKQRQWVSEGLAQTVNILRENDDIRSMGDRIVAHVVKYVNANQAGLFTEEENNDEKSLQLLSCYAYERKKYRQKTIAIGEGLLGQAYLEKEHIYLTEIPEDYVTITSGLGKNTPRSLLVMPLKINDEVEGVLELASFREIEPYEIEFIETVGESIAAALKNARVSAQTKILLEESRQRTEEMQAQEEEMRQNMEELQATQEQSQRLRDELEEEQKLLQEKLQELEAAQSKNEEVQRIEKQKSEEQIKAHTKVMEKTIAKFEENERKLKEKIKEQEATIHQLSA